MKDHPTPHPLAICAPSAGFPLTICVIAYGPHAALARRFLASLYANTDPALFHLRAGLNEVEPATEQAVRTYAERFGNITTFKEPKNIFKSPLMRRMFHEPALAAAWTVWCDDDTHFTRPDWQQRLGLKIECSPEIVMWGKLHALWRRDKLILDWIKAAAWYRGLPCLRGKDPDGNDAARFSFANGGFWAMRTDVLRLLNWPDVRLIHANEDFLLGEALRQNQLKIGRFDYGVKVNDAPRRNPDAPEVRELGI